MNNRVTAADLPSTWADWSHDLQSRYLALCHEADAWQAGMLDRCDAPTSPDECATMRERLVAGTAEPVPDCPVHGPWRDDQTPPVARLTARTAPDAVEIAAAVTAAANAWGALGLRVHGTKRAPRIGSVLPDSRRYVDGSPTRQRLRGVSTIAVAPATVERALRDLHLTGDALGGYEGAWLVLVAGAYASGGEDIGESVIVDGCVLAVWPLSTDGR